MNVTIDIGFVHVCQVINKSLCVFTQYENVSLDNLPSLRSRILSREKISEFSDKNNYLIIQLLLLLHFNTFEIFHVIITSHMIFVAYAKNDVGDVVINKRK